MFSTPHRSLCLDLRFLGRGGFTRLELEPELTRGSGGLNLLVSVTCAKTGAE